MKISLIHPSRGRPEKSFMNAREWITQAGCAVDLIVGVDLTDVTQHDYIKYYGAQCYVFPSQNVVQAANAIAKKSTGDILIYLSDDFKCFPNWGEAVVKELEGVTEPMLIKVDDCLQGFHVPVLTIPIMNRALYERLGYFWHPGYRSQFVDEDLYWVTKNNGWLKNCPHLKFEHQHVSVGKAKDDETYRRNAANWEQGKALFAQRKKQGFPL